MRTTVVLAAAALTMAGCSGGDGTIDDAGSTDTSDRTAASTVPTTPPTSTSSTTPTTSPTTSAPPPTAPPTTAVPRAPEPIVERQIVVAGPEEVVFDWTTDQCEPTHIPDIAARAYRDADGNVELTIGHFVNYRMIGPTLDEVVTDCSTVLLRSDYDPDPAQFDDSEWIGSPYTFDGKTIYAVVHNEYRGDTHPDARPGQCPSGRRLPCLDTSFTMQISTDGGDTFDDIAPPPNHLIATLPYQYLDDSVPSGIRQPSNIIEGPDGFFYLFGNISDQPAEDQWVCAMRTNDLADPGSWRFWDGSDFTGVWKNPYLEPVDPDVDKCAPVALPQLGGGINEGIVFDEELGLYVMVGAADAPAGPPTAWGFYYSTSADLIHWSARRLLSDLPIGPSVADPDNDTVHAYPSIIDPDSASMNFSTSDGRMYLYVSRFNFGGNSLDRDLLRVPIEVRDVEVDGPDWTFDTDGDAEGWTAEFDVADFSVADGALTLLSAGDDATFLSGPLVLPAAFDTIRIRMKVSPGVDPAAELFFVTDGDPEYDGDKLHIIELIDDGEYHDYEVDLSSNPAWDGTITRLRFDPVTLPDREVAIDRIWFTG
jgi:hypothetical protein